MQEAKLVLQRTSSLAKYTRFLRPADLEFIGRPVSVLISGDMAEIKLQAIFRKGLFLWFLGEGQFVPSLSGLNLGPSIYCKNTGSEAVYEEVVNRGIIVDLKTAIKRSSDTKRSWRKGELIELELKAPCETLSFLEFPSGLDGTQEILEGQVLTRFKIRKRSECQDVVIKNYRWKRSLNGLLPLLRIRVIKNGTEAASTFADVIKTISTSAQVSSLNVSASEEIETLDDPPLSSHQLEISLGLSFEQPTDEYEIIFISRTQ